MKQCMLAFMLGAACFHAQAQGTAFTYQGRLDYNASPITGAYDLRFVLYDSASGGNTAGDAITNLGAGLSNGLFTVTLDFGPDVFNGAERWLEIGVRTNGADVFNRLDPRQRITASPDGQRPRLPVRNHAPRAGRFHLCIEPPVHSDQQ